MPKPAKPSADLGRAITHLTAKDWQAAHGIVQHDESTLAAWLHGIVHTLEGDLDNARYWYRRCGKELRAELSTADELREIKARLG